MKKSTIFIIILILIALPFTLSLHGCGGDDGNGVKPKPAVKIDATFFPMAPGDTWYFTGPNKAVYVRSVGDDTTVLGKTCTKILQNGYTEECWSIDSAGFNLHLLDSNITCNPPLVIPFSITDSSYDFASRLLWSEGGNNFYVDIAGTLSLNGFVQKTVTAGTFDTVPQLHYAQTDPSPDAYDEWYARGVGLLDNGDLVLDSAFIGGVWYRP